MSDQRGHLRQIDLLKGLAILGVMARHVVPGGDLDSSWSALHIDQAVPVFFVLMGHNAARSLRRRGTRRLGDLYTRAYALGRVERLLVPFLVIWVVALVAAALKGHVHLGPLTAAGVLPLDGPGNYFVTIVFEFALIFPAIHWAYVRAPWLTIAGCFAADAAFELFAGQSGAFGHGHDPYLYDASILRYLAVIALGVWLANARAVPYRALAGLATLSVAYLVTEHQHPGWFSWLLQSFGRTTNFISAFYALGIVVLGLALLPAGRTALGEPLAALGRASFHVFLVQIVWFGVFPTHSLALVVPDLLACSVLGYALYAAMGRLPPLWRRTSADLPSPDPARP
jgi:hypothetical protein